MRTEVPERRAELAAVMSGVSERRPDAIQRLFTLATPPLRRMVRTTFDNDGIRVPPDLVDDIVRDLVVELIDLAGSWRPDGGATPWHWARSRLLARAYRSLGTFADDIDDHHDLAERSRPATSEAETTVELLDRASTRHPLADLLQRGLAARVSERHENDGLIWPHFGGVATV